MKHGSRMFILTILIFSCHDKSDTNEVMINEKATQKIKQRKIKSITSISFITNYFSPDSLVFNEKVIQYFDTLGQPIETQNYLLDSTIVYKHHYQIFMGDTLLKIEKRIGNVYKPKVEFDTLKYLNGKIIESKSTSTYRYTKNKNGNEIIIPLPTRVYFEYDNNGMLVFTNQLHDNKIYQCSFSYNSKKQLVVKRCSYGKKSYDTYIEKIYYNDKGLKIKQIETTYEKGKVVAEYKRFYKYDLNDSLIYQTWYKNGENFIIYNYVFNEQGQKLAEYIYNDSSGDSTQLSQQSLYHYDEKRNLKMFSIIGKNGGPMQTKLFFYNKDSSLFEERQFTHTIDLDKRAVLTRNVTQYYYEYY